MGIIFECSFAECYKPAHRRGICEMHYSRWLRNKTYESKVPNRINGTPEERFWAKVDPCRTDGCAIWLGGLNTDGYGSFGLDGGIITAHQFLIGKAPEGLEWDHTCSVRKCVWPDHLEAVTHTENISRGRGNWRKFQTHCKRGHEFSEENTHFYSSGGRVCRVCQRERGRGYYRQKNPGSKAYQPRINP